MEAADVFFHGWAATTAGGAMTTGSVSVSASASASGFPSRPAPATAAHLSQAAASDFSLPA